MYHRMTDTHMRTARNIRAVAAHFASYTRFFAGGGGGGGIVTVSSSSSSDDGVEQEKDLGSRTSSIVSVVRLFAKLDEGVQQNLENVDEHDADGSQDGRTRKRDDAAARVRPWDVAEHQRLDGRQ